MKKDGVGQIEGDKRRKGQREGCRGEEVTEEERELELGKREEEEGI